MNGTDHPPSTTDPARPVRARRVLITGMIGMAAAAGTFGLAGASSDQPAAPGLDLTAGAEADPWNRTSSPPSLLELLEDPVSALAASDAFVLAVPPSDPAHAAEIVATTTTEGLTTAASTTTAAPTTTAPATTAPPTTAPPTTTPTTTAPPPPPTTEAPPPEPQYAYGDPNDPASWDRMAQCESGGNWHINTGNGYYGGLQFSLSSWQAVGGTGYPHEHSREVQIEMGQRLHAQGGWAHWPSCSRQLGYR